MTGDIRSAIADLGLTQTGAARLLDVDPRTVRRWCRDSATVPGPVWRLLALLTVPDNKTRLMEMNQMPEDKSKLPTETNEDDEPFDASTLIIKPGVPSMHEDPAFWEREREQAKSSVSATRPKN